MIELLKASIRDALSENALSLSNTFIPTPIIGDPELDDHLRQLAKQINDKTNEIVAKMSTIVDTFDLTTKLPPFNSAHLNELLHGNDEVVTNQSVLFDGASWMQNIYDQVAAIEAWEENASNLSLLVISDFDARRNISAIMEEKEAEVMLELYKELNASAKKTLNDDEYDSPPPDFDSIWDSVYAETSRIPPEVSLDIIKNAQLKSYLLRRDNMRDVVIVSEKERKTRRHIGVIDPGTLLQNVSVNGKVDPTAVFSYNIGAVTLLADLHDDISAGLMVSSRFLDRDDTFQSKLRRLKDSFQNPKHLALDVAALEAEEGLSRVEVMTEKMMHSISLNLTLCGQKYMQTSHASRDASVERMNIAEREYKAVREDHLDHAGASIDAVLAYFAALDDMKSIYTSTSRELLEMIEEAAIESNVAQEVIHAEAEIERENEFVSMNQIKLLGNAHIEEVIQSIENIFWNVAACFHHVVSTSTGRQQFVFYTGVVASLVLFLTTSKEIISLASAVILRLFVTPRLVREYGNLRTRMLWSSSEVQTKMDSIVLPPLVKERIEQSAKIASFASKRRFPMRNILLYGKPGSGKSVTAKAIAQSITSLPYAIMSGADVFPLGSKGPSELRRLLSWANKNGGVIIIDEAESALGKRGKAIQDDDEQHKLQVFSRDCLNVLLSLTGTMGNIMLILTTTNPGELDEAVLDRMDEIIPLPSLASTERTDLLRNHFFRLFEVETERPTSFIDRMLRVIRRSTVKARYDNKFDVMRSISDLANAAGIDTLSARELEKLLQGVAYKSYASDKGVLSQTLWDEETQKLIAAFTAKHKGMSIEANGCLRRIFTTRSAQSKPKKRNRSKRTNRIQYRPVSSPNVAEDDDENLGLGYNEFLLGKHAMKKSISVATETPSASGRAPLTRGVLRSPLGDITPMKVFE